MPDESTPDQTKRCTKCGTDHPVADFHRDRTRPDGRFPQCRFCQKAYKDANVERQRKRDHDRYWSNPEAERQRYKAYRLANPDKVRESGRRYQQANAETLRQKRRTYYAANHQRILANARRYHAEHRDEIRAKDRARYWANVEKYREQAKRYRLANRGKVLAALRRWRQKNIEREREKARVRASAYYRAKPESTLQAGALRRARVHNARIGKVSYAAILRQHGWVCHICGGSIAGRADLHFDHVVPLSRGGSHSNDNIRPAHAFCNLSKHDNLL